MQLFLDAELASGRYVARAQRVHVAARLPRRLPMRMSMRMPKPELVRAALLLRPALAGRASPLHDVTTSPRHHVANSQSIAS